jgi:hypothetical protein
VSGNEKKERDLASTVPSCRGLKCSSTDLIEAHIMPRGFAKTIKGDGPNVMIARKRGVTRTISFRVSADETLDIGEDTGTPVSEDYHVPFKFSGTLDKFVVDLGEAGLSPQDQKELDQQEGSNEVVD